MINFDKLGEFSVFSVELNEVKHYYVYSHIADDTIYGWKFETKIEALKKGSSKKDLGSLEQILRFDENEIVLYRCDDDYQDEECEDIKYKLIKASKYQPVIYTGFEYKFLKQILKKGINIYHDYMDQAFCCLQGDYPEKKFKCSDFQNDDGMASYFVGESLYINKKDYDSLQ